MVREDYVSFETAKLLKEKGFDGLVLSCYGEDGAVAERLSHESNEYTSHSFLFPRATYQLVFKWLREEKFIFVEMSALSQLAYVYRVAILDDPEGRLCEDYACEEGERFMSYTEAAEHALDYVLNNILTEE